MVSGRQVPSLERVGPFVERGPIVDRRLCVELLPLLERHPFVELLSFVVSPSAGFPTSRDRTMNAVQASG